MNSKSTRHLLTRIYLPLGLVGFLFLLVFFLGSYAQQTKEQYQQKSIAMERLQQQVQQLVLLLEQPGAVNASLAAQLNQLDYAFEQAQAALETQDLLVRKGEDAEQVLALQGNWNTLKVLLEQLNPGNGQPHTMSAVLQKIQTMQEAMLLYTARLAVRTQEVEAIQGWSYLLLGLLFCSAVLWAGYYLWVRVMQPLRRLEKQTASLAGGEACAAEAVVTGCLFSEVYTNLQQHIAQIQELSRISQEIGTGTAMQRHQELQNYGLLGASIEQMEDRINTYLQDEEKRSWSSQGIDLFSKLLRDNGQEVGVLSKELLSKLVPFINANQGALFTLEQEESAEPVLELQAAYAWGRHKFMTKTVAIGEGIVGQVALEKDIVVLTDVPEGFISIGSGLGKAKPRCILLLPLMVNDRFEGVLELASFQVFSEHEISFLKKLAESLAATLGSIKANSRTKQLLQKANAANANLQSQEEELRQNTEELMATQEAMLKKEVELTGLFTSINFSLFTAELSVEGGMIGANEKLLSLLGQSEQQLCQRRYFQVLQVPGWKEEDKRKFQANLLEGRPENMECRLVGREDIWLSASFTPVRNNNGEVCKIMMLASDISEKKMAELAYKAQADEIIEQEEKLRIYTKELEQLQASLSSRLQEARKEMQRQIEEIASEKAKNEAILEGCVDGVVSFNEQGVVEFFNRAAEEIWENSREEVLGRKVSHLIPLEIQYQDRDKAAEPQVFFVKNGSRKMLDIRTEVPLIAANGEEVEALLTLTRVKVNNTYMFTAFVQKVAVELF